MYQQQVKSCRRWGQEPNQYEQLQSDDNSDTEDFLRETESMYTVAVCKCFAL